MRLLIFGHHSDTGFGVVTRNLATQFLARGVDVRILAVNHRGEPVKGPIAGRVWPANMFGDPFGGNLSAPAITGALWSKLDSEDDWKPDQVLAISDMSGFQGHMGAVQNLPAWLSVPVWHYCPIEGGNLPPSWRDIWNDPLPNMARNTNTAGTTHRGFNLVAMATYGQQVLSEHLGRPVPMISHGVDTDTFRPVSAVDPLPYDGRWLRSKEDCKRAFGFGPTDKIVLRTDRHVPRKFYHSLLRAMGEVFDADPDVYLLIHCRPQDEGGDLLDEIARLPQHHWPHVKLTQAHDTWRGLTTSDLVVLMNAADLYVSTTSGEGFGLTLAESLACEVPVVVTDWAADAETVGPGGIAVPPLHDAYGEPVTFHSTYGMDWAVPDHRAFVEPITTLLAKPHRRKAMGEAGRRHVLRSFQWTAAADQFLTLFESVTLEAAA